MTLQSVGIQLLLSPLRRRQHLLEEAEPVSTTTAATDSKAQKMTKAKSKSDEKVEKVEKDELEPKHKIPSSLVTLTELEKRQLEDVLMRIGLKDCGL